MRRTSAALAVLALAAASLVAQAPAAHAVMERSFDVETIEGPAPDNGSARAWGTLAWHDRSKVVITGRINDRCPADGYGAYLEVWIFYGQDGVRATPDAGKDDGGCDDADGVAINRVAGDFNRRITKVEFRLREIDQPFTSGDHTTQVRFNPFS